MRVPGFVKELRSHAAWDTLKLIVRLSLGAGGIITFALGAYQKVKAQLDWMLLAFIFLCSSAIIYVAMFVRDRRTKGRTLGPPYVDEDAAGQPRPRKGQLLIHRAYWGPSDTQCVEITPTIQRLAEPDHLDLAVDYRVLGDPKQFSGRGKRLTVFYSVMRDATVPEAPEPLQMVLPERPTDQELSEKLRLAEKRAADAERQLEVRRPRLKCLGIGRPLEFSPEQLFGNLDDTLSSTVVECGPRPMLGAQNLVIINENEDVVNVAAYVTAQVRYRYLGGEAFSAPGGWSDGRPIPWRAAPQNIAGGEQRRLVFLIQEKETVYAPNMTADLFTKGRKLDLGTWKTEVTVTGCDCAPISGAVEFRVLKNGGFEYLQHWTTLPAAESL